MRKLLAVLMVVRGIFGVYFIMEMKPFSVLFGDDIEMEDCYIKGVGNLENTSYCFFKKILFSCLSAVVGLFGVYRTIVAGFLYPQLGFETIDVCLITYLGVLFPAAVLETAIFLCFKKEKQKIYIFDIISLFISVAFILLINGLFLFEILWTDTWIIDFFIFQGPWFIAMVVKIVVLKYRPRKTIKREDYA